MRALITGASGFVGGYLVDHLVACGDDVVCTDRSTGGADIVDRGATHRVLADASPDVVYHLAGQADVAASWADPQTTLRVNAEGTMNVLEAAAACNVGRVVVVTSAEVYGHVVEADLPLTEDRPLAPASPYAASKAAAEMIAIQWGATGLDVVRARAFNHLGPGQSERFVAAALAGRMVRARQRGERSITVGNLLARRDFTDVRDVVRAYRLLATHGTAGQAYNVCSGTDRSIAELVELFMERVGDQLALEPDPALQRPSDIPVLRGDPSRIRRDTGWAPAIAIETTVDDIIASLSGSDAPAPTR